MISYSKTSDPFARSERDVDDRETPRSGAGGSAMQAGADFQNRVGAWIATRILAEEGSRVPWDLPAEVTLTSLRVETDRPVDDLFVITSAGGEVFLQVKHSLSLSASEGSPLASAVVQIVRQYYVWQQAQVFGATKTARGLTSHRLVLAVGPNSPATIKHHLRDALSRVRGREPGQPPDAFLMNADQRNAYNTLQVLIERVWVESFRQRPGDEEIFGLLDLMRIHTLDVSPEGQDELTAKDLLVNVVLKSPIQVDTAWNSLVTECARYGSTRTGGDRLALAKVLTDAGIALQAPRSYRDDIEQLQEHSRRTMESLQDRSQLQSARK